MLIRKDDFFYVSTGITGESEMIPLEPQDVEELKGMLERDDIEEMMVELCEDDTELMEMIENDFNHGGNAVENLITKIISMRNPLIETVTKTIVKAELEALYEKMRYENLLNKMQPEDQQNMELEQIFAGIDE